MRMNHEISFFENLPFFCDTACAVMRAPAQGEHWAMQGRTQGQQTCMMPDLGGALACTPMEHLHRKHRSRTSMTCKAEGAYRHAHHKQS